MLGGTSDGLRASPRKDAAFPACVWAGSRWADTDTPALASPRLQCPARLQGVWAARRSQQLLSV